MNQAESFQKLTDNLDEQIKVYRSLLEIVRREKEILISTRLDDLNENNRSKEAHLLRLRTLEQDRLVVAVSLAQAVGAEASSPRLQEMARFLPEVESQKLLSQHSVLSLLLKRVQEINKQNESLVDSALDKITGAMKAIRDTLQENPTYQKKGEKTAQPASSGHLVSREA